MKKIDEQLWWKYMDGDCSETEREQIEILLENNAEYREEYQLHLALKQELSLIPLEQPSSQFIANVMAELPLAEVEVEPVVSPRLIRWFWLSLVLFMGGVLVLTFSLSTPTTQLPHWYANSIDIYQQIISGLSSSQALAITLILWVGSLLLGIDRWLSRRLVC